MDPWLKMVLIMIACIVALMCYSAIVVASDADDRAEQMRKELEEDERLNKEV